MVDSVGTRLRAHGRLGLVEICFFSRSRVRCRWPRSLLAPGPLVCEAFLPRQVDRNTVALRFPARALRCGFSRGELFFSYASLFSPLR